MEIQQKKSFNLLKKTFLSKTILLITDNFMPETNASATRAWAHTRVWVEKGYKVKVLTTAPNYPFGKVYQGYSNKLFSSRISATQYGLHHAGVDLVRVRVCVCVCVIHRSIHKIGLHFALSGRGQSCRLPKDAHEHTGP